MELYSQENDSIARKSINIEYTDKGFQFSSSDERYKLHIEARLQFRYATPFDQNPLTFEEVYDERSPVLNINRARLKVGGNAFDTDLNYYFEYELAQGNLLDFRIMFTKWKGFNIKVGQWKTFYNRERVISSGKQQMVERSIINRPFTIDRQQGVSFYGRLFEGSLADLTYHLSVLTGTGRGNSVNDDGHLMYAGRLQWNVFGRELGMSGSDFNDTLKPTGLVAFAAVTNRSPYTRFSQDGGGQLMGYEDAGLPGQFRVNQMMLETAFKYKGFSWQSEWHYKDIDDTITDLDRILSGYYLQGGYFFSNVISFIPKPLELAARFATYKPFINLPDNLEQETAIVANWFFKGGHRNKLSAEVTYFNFEEARENQANGWRFRLQWEISF